MISSLNSVMITFNTRFEKLPLNDLSNQKSEATNHARIDYMFKTKIIVHNSYTEKLRRSNIDHTKNNG